MRRLRPDTRILILLAGSLGTIGCFPPPKRIVFDPFMTPFAVVPDQPACKLSDTEGLKWMSVPAVNPPDKTQNGSTPATPRKGDGDATGFCVYKWVNEGTPPTGDDFKRIGAVPDGAVVGIREHPPSAIPALPDTVWRPLRDAFDAMAIDVPAAHWQDLVKGRLGRRVKVAVVDATPKDLRYPDHSLHGFALSQVIGRILCRDVDGDDCRSLVRPYLALPMVTATKGDFDNGGLFGTFFQLHDAISQALREWNQKDEDLVINLSLGWDPIKNDEYDPNVKSIRSLLERASCMGAIIVASAGNAADAEGPVFPAAFEEFGAPDAARCQTLGAMPFARPKAKGTNAVSPNHPAYAPLVHAVGAVDSLDQRLVSDRRWGQPRLAAYGMNVLVPGPKGIPYTPPVTGTSISAAIVSGIAAAVWSVRPDLDAAGVMALVYGGGVELDGGENSKRARTDFCLGEHFGPCLGPERKVHRAYLCGALRQALAQATPPETLKCGSPGSPEAAGAAGADHKSDPDPRLVPSWPPVPLSGPPPAICHVPNCGLPHGPSKIQVAGISSHGGVAGCPGCLLHIVPVGSPVVSWSGTVDGIPTGPTPMPTMTSEIAVLKVYYTTTPVQTFTLVGSDGLPPVFGVQMSLPMSSQPKPWAAKLAWYYYIDGSWIQDPPWDGTVDGGGVTIQVTKN